MSEERDREPAARLRRRQVSDPLAGIGNRADASLEEGELEIEEAEFLDLSEMPEDLREPMAPPSLNALPPASDVPDDNAVPETPNLQSPAPAVESVPEPAEVEVVQPTEPEEPKGQLVMPTRKLVMNKAPWLPIRAQNDKGTDLEQVLTHALSAMAIRQGEASQLNIDIRAYPAYKPEASEWIAAISTGELSYDDEAGVLPGASGSVVAAAKRALAVLFSDSKRGKAKRQDKGDDKPYALTQKDTPKAFAARKAAEDRISAEPHFEVSIRSAAYAVSEPGEAVNKRRLETVAHSILAAFNPLSYKTYQSLQIVKADDEAMDLLRGTMQLKQARELLLTAEELGTFCHLPNDLTRPQHITIPRAGLKPLRPMLMPPTVSDPTHPPKDLIPMGTLNRGSADEKTLAVQGFDLNQHMLVLGKSGVGKSVWGARTALALAQSGYPLVILDPHGTARSDQPGLADTILAYICTYCPERLDDVVYLNLNDPQYLPAFNPLDIADEDDIEDAVDSVLLMLRKVKFDEKSTPRAITYADAALQAMCYANLALSPKNKLGILQVPRFFSDDEFRQIVMEFSQSEQLNEVFDYDQGEYQKLSDQDKLKAAQPIARAFRRIARQKQLSRMFATTDRLDFGQLVAERKIVICNLKAFGQKNLVGEMVADTLFPALLRSLDHWGGDQTGGEPVGLRLMIDEAPILFNEREGIEEMFAGVRKWNMGILPIAQYLHQFKVEQRKAMVANTQFKIAFQHDVNETGGIVDSIAPTGEITAQDLAQLPKYTYYANWLVNGHMSSGPMALSALPPLPTEEEAQLASKLERVVTNTRKLIGVSVQEADERRVEPGYLARPMEEMMAKLKTMGRTHQVPKHPEHDLSAQIERAAESADGFDWEEIDPQS